MTRRPSWSLSKDSGGAGQRPRAGRSSVTFVTRFPLSPSAFPRFLAPYSVFFCCRGISSHMALLIPTSTLTPQLPCWNRWPNCRKSSNGVVTSWRPWALPRSRGDARGVWANFHCLRWKPGHTKWGKLQAIPLFLWNANSGVRYQACDLWLVEPSARTDRSSDLADQSCGVPATVVPKPSSWSSSWLDEAAKNPDHSDLSVHLTTWTSKTCIHDSYK